jgi:hypothetical protein
MNARYCEDDSDVSNTEAQFVEKGRRGEGEKVRR